MDCWFWPHKDCIGGSRILWRARWWNWSLSHQADGEYSRKLPFVHVMGSCSCRQKPSRWKSSSSPVELSSASGWGRLGRGDHSLQPPHPCSGWIFAVHLISSWFVSSQISSRSFHLDSSHLSSSHLGSSQLGSSHLGSTRLGSSHLGTKCDSPWTDTKDDKHPVTTYIGLAISRFIFLPFYSK